MKDFTHEHAFRKAMAMTTTERKMQKMLNWYRLSMKAHTRWLEAMDRLNAYDVERDDPHQVWTLLESRDALLQKAVDHVKAHLYCINKADEIKATL